MSTAPESHAPVPVIPTIYQSPLRVAEGSADLFPSSTETLTPQAVHEHDRRALLIVGALGVRESFDTLDNWLRFRHRESRQLQSELERNSRSTYAAIQTAARYAVSRMNVIVPNYDHTGTPDPNQANYQKHPLFTEMRREAQRAPLDRIPQQRVQLARISIFGSALFQKQGHKL